jgi:hypothetical protein
LCFWEFEEGGELGSEDPIGIKYSLSRLDIKLERKMH